MQPINWESEDSKIFVNTRFNPILPSVWPGFQDLHSHIWIATSGTTQEASGSIKWVALSKKAFLISAAAVNAHIKSSSSDIWLNALPLSHVGGLSIYARAFLSGAAVEKLNAPKWTPSGFIDAVNQSKATLTSLVPAQIFDLIQAGYPSPDSLRSVFIGGGAMSDELYQKAIALNWKILPSFGMSECCSQIATAHLGDSRLSILPHVSCSCSKTGLLQIKSEALLTGYLQMSPTQVHFQDPKEEGILTTDDLVEIKEGFLSFLGRKTDWIKIGGENVSLFHLETYFNRIKPVDVDAVLNAIPDARLGKIIELVTLKKHADAASDLISRFNAGVMPYEKIRNTRFVEAISRSDLGKVLRSQFLTDANQR